MKALPKFLENANPFLVLALYTGIGYFVAPLFVTGKRNREKTARVGGLLGLTVGSLYAQERVKESIEPTGQSP